MFEALFGSKIREQLLVYLVTNEEGYARQIARFYKTDVSQVQKQLERLQQGGVVLNRMVGNIRLYRMDSAFPLYHELVYLVEKIIALQSGEGQAPVHLDKGPEETTHDTFSGSGPLAVELL